MHLTDCLALEVLVPDSQQSDSLTDLSQDTESSPGASQDVEMMFTQDESRELTTGFSQLSESQVCLHCALKV